MNKEENSIFYDEKTFLVDKVLSEKIYRISKHIEDTIKEYGDISQFKEDVMYVIHFLLERVETKNLTATEISVKQMNYRITKAKEEQLEKIIDKQNKVIDEMAKRLEDEELYVNVNGICLYGEDCHEDCKDCIKQYFIRKVEEDE